MITQSRVLSKLGIEHFVAWRATAIEIIAQHTTQTVDELFNDLAIELTRNGDGVDVENSTDISLRNSSVTIRAILSIHPKLCLIVADDDNNTLRMFGKPHESIDIITICQSGGDTVQITYPLLHTSMELTQQLRRGSMSPPKVRVWFAFLLTGICIIGLGVVVIVKFHV